MLSTFNDVTLLPRQPACSDPVGQSARGGDRRCWKPSTPPSGTEVRPSYSFGSCANPTVHPQCVLGPQDRGGRQARMHAARIAPTLAVEPERSCPNSRSNWLPDERASGISMARSSGGGARMAAAPSSVREEVGGSWAVRDLRSFRGAPSGRGLRACQRMAGARLRRRRRRRNRPPRSPPPASVGCRMVGLGPQRLLPPVGVHRVSWQAVGGMIDIQPARGLRVRVPRRTGSKGRQPRSSSSCVAVRRRGSRAPRRVRRLHPRRSRGCRGSHSPAGRWPADRGPDRPGRGRQGRRCKGSDAREQGRLDRPLHDRWTVPRLANAIPTCMSEENTTCCPADSLDARRGAPRAAPRRDEPQFADDPLHRDQYDERPGRNTHGGLLHVGSFRTASTNRCSASLTAVGWVRFTM